MHLWKWKDIGVINAHERDASVNITGLREAIRLAEENVLHPEKDITHHIEISKY